MIYPFWEMGEDKYKEEYKVPEVDCVTYDPIFQIISNKLNTIYDNISYMGTNFPFIDISKRKRWGTDITEHISIYNKNTEKVYTTRLNNNNICYIEGKHEEVYKLGQNKSIGYKTTIYIFCHWKPLNLDNTPIQDFTFSYETLYLILKDCETVWNPTPYIK